jgi:hypothetical protein
MTNEQMERAIEFLLENQAALTARLDVTMQATQANAEAIQQLTAKLETNMQAIEKLTRVVAEIGVQIGQATQTALETATQALLTTDNHERRLRALENPPS